MTKDATAAFTFCLLIVAIVQAALFLWQLRYMRKGIEDAISATKAAKDAANAASEADGISREAFKVTERALVFLDGFDYELTTLLDIPHIPTPNGVNEKDRGLFVSRFAILPKWRNNGNTPTKQMQIQIDWMHFPDYPGPGFTFAYRKPAIPLFVAPKSVECGDVIEIGAANALINTGIGSSGQILIWGKARYVDVFDTPHFSDWCYRVRFESHAGGPLRAHFHQWGTYNETD
jgi:hypothetical protein